MSTVNGERPEVRTAADTAVLDFHVDIEPIDGEKLASIRLGRNKLLRRVSLVVFGAAVTAALRASPTYADHCNQCTRSQPPNLCGPSNECCCCNSSGCCSVCCSQRCGQCPGTSCPDYGWTVAVPVGGGCYDMFFCGDWWSCGHGQSPPNCAKCICRTYQGTVC